LAKLYPDFEKEEEKFAVKKEVNKLKAEAKEEINDSQNQPVEEKTDRKDKTPDTYREQI